MDCEANAVSSHFNWACGSWEGKRGRVLSGGEPPYFTTQINVSFLSKTCSWNLQHSDFMLKRERMCGVALILLNGTLEEEVRHL